VLRPRAPISGTASDGAAQPRNPRMNDLARLVASATRLKSCAVAALIRVGGLHVTVATFMFAAQGAAIAARDRDAKRAFRVRRQICIPKFGSGGSEL
jgi:hypothetical protein